MDGLLADCETVEAIYSGLQQADSATAVLVPAGILSHDTLHRVFRRLNPYQFEPYLTRRGPPLSPN